MATETRELGNGEIGYCMPRYRADDCLRPAIATMLQIPPAEIPDPRIDERLAAGDTAEDICRDAWAGITSWLAERDLQLVFQEPFPDRERWIGVVRVPGITEATSQPDRPADELLARFDAFIIRDRHLAFYDHCLVMRHDRCHFDPAVGLSVPAGHQLRTYDPSEIAYAITIEPKETN